MYKNKIKQLVSKYTTDVATIDYMCNRYSTTKYLKRLYIELQSREKETGLTHIIPYLKETMLTKDMTEEQFSKYCGDIL